MSPFFSNIRHFVFEILTKSFGIFFTLFGKRRTQYCKPQHPPPGSQGPESSPDLDKESQNGPGVLDVESIQSSRSTHPLVFQAPFTDDILLSEMAPPPAHSPFPASAMFPSLADVDAQVDLSNSPIPEEEALLNARARMHFVSQLPPGGEIVQTEETSVFEEMIRNEERNREEIGDGGSAVDVVESADVERVERVDGIQEFLENLEDVSRSNPDSTPRTKTTDTAEAKAKAKTKAKAQTSIKSEAKPKATSPPPSKRKPQSRTKKERKRDEEETEEIVFLDGFSLDPGNIDHIALRKSTPTGFAFNERRVRVRKAEWERLSDEEKFNVARYSYER